MDEKTELEVYRRSWIDLRGTLEEWKAHPEKYNFTADDVNTLACVTNLIGNHEVERNIGHNVTPTSFVDDLDRADIDHAAGERAYAEFSAIKDQLTRRERR